MMIKVLVTGSDGLIGKFIANRLEKEGYLLFMATGGFG
jgi:nucleoside-diphosphate-sugar epimerase